MLRSGLVGVLSSPLWLQKPADASTAAPAFPASVPEGQVLMRTLEDSELAIGAYPTFLYNSSGGGGLGRATTVGNRINIEFDPAEVMIPAVDYSTARFMGVPLMPPFRIAVQPTKLQGYVDRHTGIAELVFIAEFVLTAGPLYKAPALLVTTHLTTETVKGDSLGGTGSRMDEQGCAKLVGVARLAPVDDVLLDRFLGLPTDCKAVMSSQFLFPS
ncbi:hypothetical protein WJX81_008139 [Elliptochloris bilobata]|uniref:Uncharacterized protein n=1 Tax=Elliptochloris bilobata TaxID=381761 RepID=A0AAW1QVY2_9CHLO